MLTLLRPARQEGLTLFPSERLGSLGCYIQVAARLPHKSVRDVALRVRWLARREPARAKAAAAARGGRSKEKAGGGRGRPAPPPLAPPPAFHAGLAAGGRLPGERGGREGGEAGLGLRLTGLDASHFPVGLAPPAPSQLPPGHAVGTTLELLDANTELIDAIRQRLASGSGAESRSLLGMLRENILTVLHHMEREPGALMAQMPALPVLPNLALADQLLAPRFLAG